jgi:hypothetical protein
MSNDCKDFVSQPLRFPASHPQQVGNFLSVAGLDGGEEIWLQVHACSLFNWTLKNADQYLYPCFS